MYKVVLALDTFKRMDEWSKPVVVGTFPTEAQAISVKGWVERDLQSKGYFIDEQRCHANDYEGWRHFRAVHERLPNDSLHYIGSVWHSKA